MLQLTKVEIFDNLDYYELQNLRRVIGLSDKIIGIELNG